MSGSASRVFRFFLMLLFVLEIVEPSTAFVRYSTQSVSLKNSWDLSDLDDEIPSADESCDDSLANESVGQHAILPLALALGAVFMTSSWMPLDPPGLFPRSLSLEKKPPIS